MSRLASSLAIALAAGSAAAQTIAPPDFACASTQVNGDVLLTWNLPSNPCGPFVSYDIFGSNSGVSGPYVLVASVSNQASTTYFHVGANGHSVTWYYYMVTNHNCPGFTQLSSDTLDNLDPAAPSLVNATVSGATVELNWQPFISPETFAYIVYRDISGFNPIDTVYGRNNLQYIDLAAQPQLQPEEYIIAAMDSCGNTGTTTPISHKTIHLTYGVASCAGYIDLAWTDYLGFAVSGYEVAYNVNGGTFQTAAVLSGTTASYQLTGFSDQDSLCIYVEADNGSGVKARSNMICFKVNLTQPLQDLAIAGLTVLPDQRIQINWQASKADLVRMDVQRSRDGFNFNNVQAFTPPFNLPITLSWIDTQADPAERSWHYRIVASDSCGDTITTAASQTVWLEGKARPNFTNTLEWNDPMLPGSTIDQYAIYLLDGAWNLRQTSLANETSDPIGDLLNSDGRFCYYVEASGTLALPTGSVSFVANSNTLCLEQFAIIYAPTAFVPAGTNNEFKPVISFGREGTYKMMIFNRFGQKLFETSDPSEGWSGLHKGADAPHGVYAYVIEVQGPNNNAEIKKGTVLLIR